MALGAGTRLRISVVIPTRDRAPLLRYCLRSLERQDGPAQDHEIVVINDGSRDDTAALLAGWRPACARTVIHLPTPVGRAAARNRGLAAAAGDVVAFLDGDVIAPPTLISAHRRHHAAGGPQTVVSGYPWCWRTVYTWAFADFTPGQKEAMRRFAAARGAVPPRLLDVALLDDWAAFERWAGGPLAPPHTPARTADPDGAPFLRFITADVSARRAAVVEAGGFCERFRGHGLEDWELGYRLAKQGARFVSDPAGGVYHQAHPPRERGPADFHRNYGLFLALHPDPEVALMTVCGTAVERLDAWCRTLRHLRRVAPAVAAALDEALVDHARAWARAGGRTPANARRWSDWAAHWGTARVERLLREQDRVLADPLARRGVVLLQRLTRADGA